VMILTPGTSEITGVGTSGQSDRAWIEVVQRLLLDGIG
jgi:hypothetical protein